MVSGIKSSHGSVPYFGGNDNLTKSRKPEKCEVLIVSFPTNEQSGTMCAALDLACNELGICITRHELRENWHQ
jgi:hypothetical protein